mgnify:CR=1 FL=1|jgi:hypothetical protein
MALIGGGGAGNVAGGNPSGTGTGLNYYRTAEGTYCSATSGQVNLSSSLTTYLQFTTGTETIVCQPSYSCDWDTAGTAFVNFEIKFNSEVIFESFIRRDFVGYPTSNIELVIPPYTSVEISMKAAANTPLAAIILSGRVY